MYILLQNLDSTVGRAYSDSVIIMFPINIRMAYIQ